MLQTVPFRGQDYAKLKAEHLKSGKIFVDEEFPADKTSLFRAKLFQKGIHWLRAKEIDENAAFVVGGMEANDLDQGQLGDCWFV